MAETASSVQSLDRAFELLELLCRARGGMTIAMLSAATGLHKSTVHRLLASLSAHGFVQHDADHSRYYLGMHICELGSYITENLDVVERARAPMERLSRETGETVHLVLREGLEIVYVHKVESMHGAIRMFSRIGMRRPLYCTGVGKAIVATLPEKDARTLWQESEIQAYTQHTLTDESAFFRELADVRRQGYALDNEENELGVRCIAAAIPDWSGRAAYALSISAPLSRMSNDRIRELVGPLLDTRCQIAQTLGA